MATLKNTTVTGTFQLPAGTTAQRPGVPVTGMMRYNSSYGVNEVYNGSVWWDMTYNVASDIGLGATTPAVSGTQLLQCRPTYATGNYYIQPPGQPCYQVYVDMTNQGGGWVLVGRGQQGASNGIAWWNDAGAGSYSTALIAANLSSTTVAYMPTYWVRALVGGNTWNNMGGMICNRTLLGDSFYFQTTTSQFRWSSFGGATDTQPGQTITMTYGRYTGQWLASTNSYNFTNQYWTDTLSAGAPVANDATRLFTWSWSGHSAGGVQYSGWSAGASVTTPGFTAGAEGHAIQQVNVFVK
jgi:hypothetical protein